MSADIGMNDGATIMAMPSLVDRVEALEHENLQLADAIDGVAEFIRGLPDETTYPGSEVLDGDQKIRAAALIVAGDQLRFGGAGKVDAMDLVDVADYITTGRRWRDDVPDEVALDPDVDA